MTLWKGGDFWGCSPNVDKGAATHRRRGIATRQRGVANHVRLTDVVYLNGRDVEYGYGTAGAIDDITCRVKTITTGDEQDRSAA